jgi:hypothetical protein
MASSANGTAPHPGAGTQSERTRRSYEELWFALGRRRWKSVVLVPADEEGSTASAARSLAEIGQHLSEGPVTAITVSSLEYRSALALAELQEYVHREAGAPPEPAELVEVSASEVPREQLEAKPPARARSEALAVSSAARLVIAIPPVVREPLGLNATQHADAIVISVELGRTRVADVRRTVELVGRERVAGCLLVR